MFVTFKKVKKEKTESLLINFPFTNQILGILFVPCSAESIFVCTCFRSLSFSTLTHFDDFAELKLPATIRIVVVMVTVCSNQVVAGRNPVVHCLIPVVQIQGMLAGVLKITSEMTTTEAKLAIFVAVVVKACDATDKSIVRASEKQWLVIVVLITGPSTASLTVRNRTISTHEVMDAIPLAVSVQAVPTLQRRVAAWTFGRERPVPVVGPCYSCWSGRIT